MLGSPNQQLINGAWNVNALNMVTIDGLGHDNTPTLLIQKEPLNVDEHTPWVRS